MILTNKQVEGLTISVKSDFGYCFGETAETTNVALLRFIFIPPMILIRFAMLQDFPMPLYL